MRKRILPFLLLVPLSACSIHCGPPHARSPGMFGQPNVNKLQQQSEMMQKLASEPDIPPW